MSKSSKSEVTVTYRDHTGKTVERVFSQKDHGKGFMDTAKEFCETHKDKNATIVE